MTRRRLAMLVFGAAHLNVCTALALQESLAPDDSDQQDVER
jgi:hypothetical protein